MVYEIRKPPKVFRIASALCLMVLGFEIFRYGASIFDDGLLSLLVLGIFLIICLNGSFKDYTLTISSRQIMIHSNNILVSRNQTLERESVKCVLVGSDNNDSETCSTLIFVLFNGEEVGFGPYCSQKIELQKYQKEIVEILGIDNICKSN